MKKYLILLTFMISKITLGDLLNIIQFEKHIEKNIETQLIHLLSKEDFFIHIQIEEKKAVKKIKKKPRNKALKELEVTPLSKFDLLDIKVEEEEKTTVEAKEIQIKSINAVIHIAKSVSKEQQEKTQKFIQKSYSNFSNTKITYTFLSFTKISAPVEEVQEKRFFEQLPLETTLVGISILFFIILIFGVSKFFKFGMMLVKSIENLKPSSTQANIEVNNTMGPGSTSEDTANKQSKENPLSPELRLDDEANKGDGLKNFITFLEESPAEGANQIRKWKCENTSLANNAITYTVRSLDINTLKTFLLEFTPSEKGDLIDNLTAPFEHEMKVIDTFILDSLLEILIKPSVIQDPDFHKVALTTDQEQLIQITEGNPELGAELLAILPKSLVDDVFDNIGPQTFSKVMSESLSYSKEKLKENYSNIYEALKSTNQKELKEMSPVFDQMVKYFNNATEEKENIIIDVLIKAKPIEEFTEIMFQNFPRELVPKLPNYLVKESLMKIPLKKMVAYLALQEEEVRNKLLDTVAEEGNKIRDIFELELSNLLDNPTQLDKIKGKRHEVIREYLTNLRGLVPHPKYTAMIKPLLKNWVEKKYENNQSTDTPMAA